MTRPPEIAKARQVFEHLREHSSDPPEESMEMEDFELAAEVLGGFLGDTFRATDEWPPS